MLMMAFTVDSASPHGTVEVSGEWRSLLILIADWINVESWR
jgi:hypothetical protein